MQKFKSIEDIAANFAQANQDYSGCSDEVKHAIYTAVIYGINETWSNLEVMDFSQALRALRMFKPIRRKGWNGKNLMVFRQIPQTIPEEIIPKMSSLPGDAKQQILASAKQICYTSQCLIYNTETGRADSWVPSSSDIFAGDWEVVK